MASFTKRKSGNWKAIIRRKGWPNVAKTFRIKKDAQDWARITEDEIVRGIYVPRSGSENLTIADALTRYINEVVPTKKPTTQRGNIVQARQLESKLGRYSLAVLNSTQIAAFRDQRLKDGTSINTVRLELALLSHLYSTEIMEWGLGLVNNPVKKPSATQTFRSHIKRLEYVFPSTFGPLHRFLFLEP